MLALVEFKKGFLMRPAATWWLSLSMSAAAAFAAPASAAVTEEAVQAQDAAATQLIALITEADQAEGEQSARLKRLRTPAFARLVETVSDEARLLDAGATPMAELGRAMETCNRVQNVTSAMMFFDDERQGNEKASRDYEDPSAAALVDRNTVVFQEELASLQSFLFRCMARVTPTINTFVMTLSPEEMTAERREGMKQVRSGVVMVYTGATPILGADSLGDRYKRAVLTAIAETAEAYAAVSRPVDRKQILDEVRALRKTAPNAYAADLDRIIAAFSTTDCTGLCAIE
jgi:hypothetical protein